MIIPRRPPIVHWGLMTSIGVVPGVSLLVLIAVATTPATYRLVATEHVGHFAPGWPPKWLKGNSLFDKKTTEIIRKYEYIGFSHVK